MAWIYHVQAQLEGYEMNTGNPVGEDDFRQVTEKFFEAAFDPSGRALQMLSFGICLSAGAVLYARFKIKRNGIWAGYFRL